MNLTSIQDLPDLRSAFQVFIFLILLYVVTWVIYSRYFHPLSGIPGPFWASLSRLWLAKQASSGRLDEVLRNLHGELGTSIRIAPNEVAVSDPEAIRVIYGAKPIFAKTDFYNLFRADFSPNGALFTLTDDKFHDERRRIVNSLYSMSSILEQEKYIDSCSNLFNQRMGEFAATGETVDFGEWLQMYAFDVIGELYFGKQFGFMEEKTDHDAYMDSIWNLVAVVSWVSMLPSYGRGAVMAAGFALPSVWRGISAMQNLMKIARSCVAERLCSVKEGKPTRQDNLAKLLKIHHERGEKENFLLEDVETEAYTAIVVGSDTTAIAMRSIAYRIMKNPLVYKKLMGEIDDAERAGRLSRPNVRYTEAIQLPYFLACCKEGMRLHPSISFPLPRHIPRGGKEIAGIFIPEGYRVAVSTAAVHYDKTVFGHDADVFNPDRWFRESAPNMDRYMFQFGFGNRNCIGRNIALAEIYKLLPQVLRDYRLDLEDPRKEWETLNYWFHKQVGIKVRVSKR